MLTVLVAAAIWIAGVFCGVAFGGALPIWQRQSLSTLSDVKGAQLTSLLQQGWAIEQVVPVTFQNQQMPTYILRRPVWD